MWQPIQRTARFVQRIDRRVLGAARMTPWPVAPSTHACMLGNLNCDRVNKKAQALLKVTSRRVHCSDQSLSGMLNPINSTGRPSDVDIWIESKNVDELMVVNELQVQLH